MTRTMHPGLKNLIALQALDLRIAELSAQLEKIPGRLAEAGASSAAARAVLTKAKEAHSANVKERKKFELDVEVHKDKARKFRDQTGAIKTNEAYKALLHEIEMAEAEIRKAEDRLLEHMVSGEEFDRQVKAGEKALAAADAAGREQHRTIEGEQAMMKEEHARLSAEREQCLPDIPPALLDRYHRLARRYHGRAVVEMRGEACTGCRVHLRPHMVQRVRQLDSEEIVECDSCTRILYPAAEPAAAAASAPAAHAQES